MFQIFNKRNIMKVKNMKEIAKILDNKREENGISKNQLAIKAGMSRPTMLNMIQKGVVRNGYSVDSLMKIVESLDLEIIIRPAE